MHGHPSLPAKPPPAAAHAPASFPWLHDLALHDAPAADSTSTSAPVPGATAWGWTMEGWRQVRQDEARQDRVDEREREPGGAGAPPLSLPRQSRAAPNADQSRSLPAELQTSVSENNPLQRASYERPAGREQGELAARARACLVPALTPCTSCRALRRRQRATSQEARRQEAPAQGVPAVHLPPPLAPADAALSPTAPIFVPAARPSRQHDDPPHLAPLHVG